MRYALVLILFAMCVMPVHAQAVPDSVQWEYLIQRPAGNKTGIGDIEKQQAQLDSLGRAGWELVAAPTVQLMGTTGGVVFYLKRRRRIS